MLDLLIRSGEVIDGTGAARCRADVAVAGGRVVEVGGLPGAEARTVIDAAGCIVAPGFVDMHSHGDMTLPALPTADGLVHQGITSIVAGQCGDSLAPLLPEARAQTIAWFHFPSIPVPWDEWSTFGSYLDYLTRLGTSVNVAPLVGHGMIRSGAMGLKDAVASRSELKCMVAEVERALDEGAIGLSTGLIYPPGGYTGTPELVDLTWPVARRGGL